MLAGSVGIAGLEAHRIGQPGRVDDEQHQVAAARDRGAAPAGAPARASTGARTRAESRDGGRTAPSVRAARQAAGSMRCTSTSGATLRSCLHGRTTTGAGSRRSSAASPRRRRRRTRPLYAEFAAAVADDDDVLDFLLGLPRDKQQPMLLFGAIAFLGGVRRDPTSCSPRIREDARPDPGDDARPASRRPTRPARCAALLTALGGRRRAGGPGRGGLVGRTVPLPRPLQLRVRRPCRSARAAPST